MSQWDINVKDKVVIVTGASRGIGKAIAAAFAEKGAKVIISSRKQETLDEVAGEIKSAGGEVTPIACHTGKLDQIEELYAKVDKAYGRLDVLVNNAATNPYFGDLLGIDEGLFKKTFEVNVNGYFFMAQNAAKRMVEQEGGGNIVNVASIAGMSAPPMQGVYGMTKAAVIMMTGAFAKEFGGRGVRSNAVCPGLTETKFSKVLIETDMIYQAAMQGIPMKRHAQPEEMVGAVLYLASDAASYTNGAVIPIDGGAVA